MPENKKQPDKAFFETNDRAYRLRNLCIEAIDASRAIINGDEDGAALQRLLDTNAQLTGLGITPGMHTIAESDQESEDKQIALVTDPLIAAEWLSGQIRNLIISSTGLTETAVGLLGQLQEHDELLGEGSGVYVVGPAVADKARDIGMIGMLSSMIDYDAGPSLPGNTK